MSKLLTAADVAELAQVKVDTVYSWIHSEILAAANVGRSSRKPVWRIREDDFDEFIASRSNVREQSAAVAAKSGSYF